MVVPQNAAPLRFVDALDQLGSLAVWAIEAVVPDGLGGGIDGRETATTEPEVATSQLRYQLMGSVPAAWIPFIPTHVSGSSREIQLQRGAMVHADGTGVAPLGEILRAATPYLINEEEVSRAGVRVSRTWQRARSSDACAGFLLIRAAE